jgi:hypothetical protein
MKLEDSIKQLKDLMGINVYEASALANPTVYGEAIQTLNPLTGKAYVGDFRTLPGEIEKDFLYAYDPDHKKRIYFTDTRKHILDRTPERVVPATNPEIELQKALGRMDVREGKLGGLGEFAYLNFVNDVYVLARAYAQNPSLTLDSITDVNGLNIAIGAMQNERTRVNEEKFLDYKPSFLRENDSFDIEHILKMNMTFIDRRPSEDEFPKFERNETRLIKPSKWENSPKRKQEREFPQFRLY